MMKRPGQAVQSLQRMILGMLSCSVLAVGSCLWMAGCSEAPESSAVSSSSAARMGEGAATSSSVDTPVTKPSPVESYRTIGLAGTAYYESSPAQGRPPDGELPAGTTVKLLEESGSYSLVTWEGRRAWVAVDALRSRDPQPRKVHKIPMH